MRASWPRGFLLTCSWWGAGPPASPLPSLRKVLGASGEHVYRLSWGIDARPVTPVRLEKSIGAEETFAVDTADEALLHRELLRLSHRTAERLRGAGMHALTVALKQRYADFSTITRSRTVSRAAFAMVNTTAVSQALCTSGSAAPSMTTTT